MPGALSVQTAMAATPAAICPDDRSDRRCSVECAIHFRPARSLGWLGRSKFNDHKPVFYTDPFPTTERKSYILPCPTWPEAATGTRYRLPVLRESQIWGSGFDFRSITTRSVDKACKGANGNPVLIGVEYELCLHLLRPATL